MLTGDENIVKLEFIVQYKVQDRRRRGVTDFLFNVRDPQRDAARRRRGGDARGDRPQRTSTTSSPRARSRCRRTRRRCCRRSSTATTSGIEVVTVKLQDVDPPDQVSDAFKDVISAQQDKERLINEALGYANDVVPKARGAGGAAPQRGRGLPRGRRCARRPAPAQRFIALARGVRQGEGRHAAAPLPRDDGGDPAAREQDHPRRRRRQAGRARTCRSTRLMRAAGPAPPAPSPRRGTLSMDRRWIVVLVAARRSPSRVWNLRLLHRAAVDAGGRRAARRAGAHGAASPAST